MPNMLKLNHEVLRARLNIRDFFLNAVFREVYSNIGQVLSLAKLQLTPVAMTDYKSQELRTESANKLVGQSIRDLRSMCKLFQPDSDLLKEGGFNRGIREISALIYPEEDYSIKLNDQKQEMAPSTLLIVFNMLLEILTAIKTSQGILISLILSYSKRNAEYYLKYKGQDIFTKYSSRNGGEGLTLQQRATLIEGSLVILKGSAGNIDMKLIFPLNQLVV
jgi:hypothetical protein